MSTIRTILVSVLVAILAMVVQWGFDPVGWALSLTCYDPEAYYYYQNPDVAETGVPGQRHWNKYGFDEGRKSCWKAPTVTCKDPELYYGTTHPDVRAMVGSEEVPNLLHHWNTEGHKQGLDSCWAAP